MRIKSKRVLSVLLVIICAITAVQLPTATASAVSSRPLYERESWSITGQWNYLWVNSIGIAAGEKYLIEFDIEAPTGNPSFYFDWRDYQDISKAGNTIWNGYQGIFGIFDDSSHGNDCIGIGPGFDAYPVRGGKKIDYHASVVWDTAAATFDVILSYETVAGVKGELMERFTGAGTFASSDVLKFATGSSTATLKNLNVSSLRSSTVYTSINGWNLGDFARECPDGSLKLAKTAANGTTFTPHLENGKKYEITYEVSGLYSVSGSSVKSFCLDLLADGQIEQGVLIYRLGDGWYGASGSNGQNKIIIDTATGAWEAYVQDQKATGSGYVSSASGKVHHAFNTSDGLTLRFYGCDDSAGYITPAIQNVTVTDITSPEDEVPVDRIAIDTDSAQTTVFMRNASDQAKSVLLMLAQYDQNGAFLRVSKEIKTVPAHTYQAVGNTVAASSIHPDTRTFRTFVWDDMDTMMPLVIPKEMKRYASSLKVLSIGNSMNTDALGYLYGIANDYGLETVTVGNLSIRGANLETHWKHAQSGASDYIYYKNKNGTVTTASSNLFTALQDEEWDIIVLEQASGLAGLRVSYEPYLTNLKNYILRNDPQAKLAWHMTWAYQADAPNSDFANYDHDAAIMYRSIADAVQTRILPDRDFSYIIPSGTAIENVRMGYAGDTLTADGFTLNTVLGNDTVAQTWFRTFTGCAQDRIGYVPVGMNHVENKTAKESADHAVQAPYTVKEASFFAKDVPTDGAQADYVYKCTKERDLMLTFLPPLVQKYAKAPVYFIIPGGGWYSEGRQSMIDFSWQSVQALRNEGFAVVSIDYRVSPEGVVMREIVNDCFDAARYIAHYADVFGIDPNTFALSGHSAGGHLALMVAYGPPSFFADGYEFQDGFGVKSVAPMSAPTILYDTSTHSLGVMNGLFKNNNTWEERALMSPIYYVSENTPPTLLCAGTSDSLVYSVSSERVYQALTALGVPCEIKLSTGGGHSFEQVDQGVTPSISFAQMQNYIVSFILTYQNAPS